MTRVMIGSPCGRALAPGETAVLLADGVYCEECHELLATRRYEPREFELRAGAVCGGGNPLD
jgi:hypothetical protein